MGPVGRVLPTLQDEGTKAIWSTPTFILSCLFFSLLPEQVIEILHNMQDALLTFQLRNILSTWHVGVCQVHGDDRGGSTDMGLLCHCDYH